MTSFRLRERHCARTQRSDPGQFLWSLQCTTAPGQMERAVLGDVCLNFGHWLIDPAFLVVAVRVAGYPILSEKA